MHVLRAFAGLPDPAPRPHALAHDVESPAAKHQVRRGVLTSEGTVMVTSSDPQAALEITPNWLSTEEDCQAAVNMVKYMRSYMRQPALAKFVGE